MANYNFTIQYQQHTEPVLATAETNLESKWHFPLSEPVRQKIAPGLAIALMASGLFFTPASPFPEQVLESKFHFPWSEPVRLKPGIKTHLQRAFTADTVAAFPSGNHIGWYAGFSDPVRIKPGLKSALQMAFTEDAVYVFNPFRLMPYFMALSQPVWQKKGIRSYLQQTIAYPPRLLPTPNVTMVMDAVETNNDVALFALNVYNSSGTVTSGEGARVAIIEVTPSGTGPASIRES